MTAPDPVEFECLPVAIRAWTVPTAALALTGPESDRLGPWKPTQRARRAPHRALVFDCETTTDHTQRLLYGVWRRYVDKQGIGKTCIEEGIFYADDLPERDPVGFSIVQAHARSKAASTAAGYSPRLRLLTRAEFVEQIVWKWARQQQATIVGFNLPFDLTRLATHCSPGRGRNRGGISLRLWEHNGGENRFRPRIVLRTIDGHRTLMAFTHPDDVAQFFRGRFVDVRTLAFAHTDARGLSLESACQRFGTDFTKADVEHGTISPEHIEYCRADVEATAALYRATTTEHALHPIELPAANTFSAATIGKGYWRAMGIAPTAERVPDLTHEHAGWGMEAFYGGRAECRIRRTEVPVVYTDFRSM